MLELFSAASGVTLIQRLGLRYINRLAEEDATTPAFWRDHIREPFAGPLNGAVAELVSGIHQQVQLKLGRRPPVPGSSAACSRNRRSAHSATATRTTTTSSTWTCSASRPTPYDAIDVGEHD
ncbi:MAG: hypothetical protein WKF76_09470 [Nocardioidaceae bacterium]